MTAFCHVVSRGVAVKSRGGSDVARASGTCVEPEGCGAGVMPMWLDRTKRGGHTRCTEGSVEVDPGHSRVSTSDKGGANLCKTSPELAARLNTFAGEKWVT